MESCVKVRTALLHLSLNDDGDNWSGCVPNGREFIVAEAVQQCLQPCKVATKLWESDKKASLHQVVKQLWVIDSKLTAMSTTSTPNVKLFASNLQKEIRKRFKNCGCTNKYFRLAHLLDPDIKGEILKEFRVFKLTIADAREMCRKYERTPDPEPEGGQEHVFGSEHDEGVDESSIDPLERLKKRRKTTGNQNSAPRAFSRFDVEIERYLNMPLEDCDDPIATWKENKGSFFLLRNLAAEILSIPASSSSSERAFSVGTRVNLIKSQ